MSLIIRQKRGALQLSINAIVVLILAITMLGLGLGFMRNMFESTTGQFEEISQDLKNQMIDQIRAGTDKVILNKYEIEMGKAESKPLYFGIKNVENDAAEFNIDMNCTDAINSAADPENMIDFDTFDSRNVDGGSVEVLPFNVKSSSGAILTTYSCKIKVTKGANNDPYDSKSFYVTIK